MSHQNGGRSAACQQPGGRVRRGLSTRHRGRPASMGRARIDLALCSMLQSRPLAKRRLSGGLDDADQRNCRRGTPDSACGTSRSRCQTLQLGC